MTTFLLTGATGLLGGNLLLEILKDMLRTGKTHEIWLLGKDSAGLSLSERIRAAVLEDGGAYLELDEHEQAQVIDDLLNCVHYVQSNMEADKFGISDNDLQKLSATPMDVVIHCAGMSAFLQGEEILRSCIRTNVEGTRKLLDLIDHMQVGKFFYIGSAYSSGIRDGYVKADWQNLDGFFANPYQRSKALAEQVVQEFAANHPDISVTVFRPSTIGGRLLEQRYGTVNKYDVYLVWAKMLLRMKAKQLQSWEGIYDREWTFPIHILLNSSAGLNIVPVDFCAKMLVCAALKDDFKIRSLHLANHQSTSHLQYVTQMLDWLKIRGATFVSEEPADKNDADRWYYRILNPVFLDYVAYPELDLDTAPLQQLEQSAGIHCPSVGVEAFDLYMRYAVEHNFGLPPS